MQDIRGRWTRCLQTSSKRLPILFFCEIPFWKLNKLKSKFTLSWWWKSFNKKESSLYAFILSLPIIRCRSPWRTNPLSQNLWYGFSEYLHSIHTVSSSILTLPKVSVPVIHPLRALHWTLSMGFEDSTLFGISWWFQFQRIKGQRSQSEAKAKVFQIQINPIQFQNSFDRRTLVNVGEGDFPSIRSVSGNANWAKSGISDEKAEIPNC